MAEGYDGQNVSEIDARGSQQSITDKYASLGSKFSQLESVRKTAGYLDVQSGAQQSKYWNACSQALSQAFTHSMDVT